MAFIYFLLGFLNAQSTETALPYTSVPFIPFNASEASLKSTYSIRAYLDKYKWIDTPSQNQIDDRDSNANFLWVRTTKMHHKGHPLGIPHEFL